LGGKTFRGHLSESFENHSSRKLGLLQKAALGGEGDCGGKAQKESFAVVL
jgi:hypothetical protein